MKKLFLSLLIVSIHSSYLSAAYKKLAKKHATTLKRLNTLRRSPRHATQSTYTANTPLLNDFTEGEDFILRDFLSKHFSPEDFKDDFNHPRSSSRENNKNVLNVFPDSDELTGPYTQDYESEQCPSLNDELNASLPIDNEFCVETSYEDITEDTMPFLPISRSTHYSIDETQAISNDNQCEENESYSDETLALSDDHFVETLESIHKALDASINNK